MNINMKEKINTVEYDFLRKESILGDNIILLTLGGSYAYGTNINTESHVSDIDIRGIRLNTKEEILTMNIDNKPYENKDLDVTIYPLKQIITLLSNCNPNTMEILGTRDEDIFILSEEGKMIRDNYDIFLSKIAYNSFGGYAISQLRRLENALNRDSYLDKKKLKYSMHLIRVLIMGEEVLKGGGINTYREGDRKLLLGIRNGDYSYNEIIEMSKIYEKKFQYAYENTSLPNKPDYKKINELTMEINKMVVSR